MVATARSYADTVAERAAAIGVSPDGRTRTIAETTPLTGVTSGFAGASQFVTPDDVAESIPCGPDLDHIVESVSAFWDAGFTDVCVVQVGDEGQDRFLEEAAGPLLEKLREAAP